MAHKRADVRVPIIGKVILSDRDGMRITTSARDISPGGFGVENPSAPLEKSRYQVTITIETGKHIQLTATLIHKNKENAGFKTSEIDTKNLQIITELIAEFQTTEAFITQLDKHDLLQQNFIDDDGNEISVTFDRDGEE